MPMPTASDGQQQRQGSRLRHRAGRRSPAVAAPAAGAAITEGSKMNVPPPATVKFVPSAMPVELVRQSTPPLLTVVPPV